MLVCPIIACILLIKRPHCEIGSVFDFIIEHCRFTTTLVKVVSETMNVTIWPYCVTSLQKSPHVGINESGILTN